MDKTLSLRKTQLFDLHCKLNAKLIDYSGYKMPVSYNLGIIKEHLHTRKKAGLFDVSHMGQISVKGKNAAVLLETLIPINIRSLPVWRQRYGLFLNKKGGILDDLIVMHTEDEYILIVNAARKVQDFLHLKQHLGKTLSIEMLSDLSLLALQGPSAEVVLERCGGNVRSMKFMDVQKMMLHRIPCLVSRSGYTGEDGFEISVSNAYVVNLAKFILCDINVQFIGLGARDSLRLEAGLCLYGHDIGIDTTPIEGNLTWVISPSRRLGGAHEGGFLGADIILPQIQTNVSRNLVGLIPECRGPLRSGVKLVNTDGDSIGNVTSGCFSPILGKPISMGYVDIQYLINKESKLFALERNKEIPIKVSKMPFVSHQYRR